MLAIIINVVIGGMEVGIGFLGAEVRSVVQNLVVFSSVSVLVVLGLV